MTPTGRDGTRLVVLRGNSASGKSTTARALRARLGRGTAWVEQDYLRRVVLKEHDTAGAANIGLIAQTARYALDHGYHVVLEGILYASRYADMLRSLADDHRGLTLHYYFDISFAETVRRHSSRPLAAEVDTDQLRDWYREHDLLDFTTETVIPQEWRLDQTVEKIVRDVGLIGRPHPRQGAAEARPGW